MALQRAALLYGLPCSLASSTRLIPYWCSGKGEHPLAFFSIFPRLKSYCAFPVIPPTQQPAPEREALGVALKNGTAYENAVSQSKAVTVQRHHPKTGGMVRCFPGDHVASNTWWKNYRQKESKQTHLTVAQKIMLLGDSSNSAISPRASRH